MCTPYWVVAYLGGQMTVYEGIWLSCYREKGVGSWVCSTYDTIRNLFEQPGESLLLVVVDLFNVSGEVLAGLLYSP